MDIGETKRASREKLKHECYLIKCKIAEEQWLESDTVIIDENFQKEEKMRHNKQIVRCHWTWEFVMCIMLIYPAVVYPCDEETSQINVGENGVFLYGNYVDGTLRVELKQDKIYINGIQVHPPWHLREQEIEDSGIAELSEMGKLTKSIYKFQRDLFQKGSSKEEVIEQSIAFLNKNPYVRSVQYNSGDLYKISATDGNEVNVALGADLDAEEKEWKSKQCWKLEKTFQVLCGHLESNDLLLTSTEGFTWIEASRRLDPSVSSSINVARFGKDILSKETWKDEAISFRQARQLRNPIDISTIRDGGER